MSVTIKGQKLDGIPPAPPPGPVSTIDSSHFAKHIPASPLVAKPATAYQSAAHAHKGVVLTEKHSEEVLHPGLLAPLDQMAEVLVEGGRTVNVGDFNSVRITVGVRLPCKKDDINDTYDFGVKWVGDRIAASVKDLGSK